MNTNERKRVGKSHVRKQKINAQNKKLPDVVRVKGGIDRPLLIIIILLCCFGAIMVFSSSFAYSYQRHNDSFYYIKRHMGFLIIGIAAMLGISLIDYRAVRRLTVLGFAIAVVLLVMVLIMGTAKGTAVRWVELPIIGRFQPSEVMKPMLVMLLANYFATYQDNITDYRDFKKSSIWGDLYPYIIIGFVCLLIALEKHFSGLIILFTIGTIVVFVGGARKFWMVVTGIAGGTVVGIAIAFTDYAKGRIDTWLHPEQYSALDGTYQTLQSLNAVGSGGFLGVGLGNSYQKYSYVPEPQNDFIFSIVCEELGFVGALAVIALFVLLVWRGFVVAMKAPDTFSSLVAIGLVAKVGLQSILNMAVVTAVIPNTGITLPFFSYGGTALLVLLCEMGVVLGISRYSYQDKH